MATAKRDYDVISISSDSSDDDDLVRFARPLKMARRNQLHPGPNYLQNDDAQQLNMVDLMRTGSLVKIERNHSPQLAQGHSEASPQTIGSSEHDFDVSFPIDHDNFPITHDDETAGALDRIYMLPEPSPTPPRASVPEPTTLDRVLEIVPDVCRTHAGQLIAALGDNVEQVIEQLFAKPYPKESEIRAGLEAKKQAELRAQKATEEAEKASLLHPQCLFSGKMKDVIIEILKDEFNTIPIKYIKEVQKDKRHLYATYLALNEAKHADECPYGKTPWRPVRDVNFEVLEGTKDHKANIPILKNQFDAARKAAAEWNSQRRKSIAQKEFDKEKAAAKARSEEKNSELAKASGKVVECAACFDEYPLNRVVRCMSSDIHSVCFDCMKTYLVSETGQSSFRLACPGGCGDTFGEPQLRRVPDADSQVDELMRLRQEHDIRTAGIEDVEACPFCDFKTVCLPIEIDFEFHCQNEACTITSCRKCKETTHIPESCEESQRKHSKDAALSHRHKIEEARSKALIRNCNKCKRAFIKSEGCNKMTCPTCGNLQCYLCGVDVTANYAHFQLPNSCPTYDGKVSVETLHAQEVEAAAEAAEAEVLREHPELNKEHLEIKFSDSVSEADKRKAAPPQPPPRPRVNLAHPMGAERAGAEIFFGDPNRILLRGQQAQDRRRQQRADQPNRARNLLDRLPNLGAAVFDQPAARNPLVDHINPARQEFQVDVEARNQYAPEMVPRVNVDNYMQPMPLLPLYGEGQAAPDDLDLFNFGTQAGAEVPDIGNDIDFDFDQAWDEMQAFATIPAILPMPARPATDDPDMNRARTSVQEQVAYTYGDGNPDNIRARPRQGHAAVPVPVSAPGPAPVVNNDYPDQDGGYDFAW